MNKIRFCDANTGDLLRSINDPTLPCIKVLRVTKARDMIMFAYDGEIISAHSGYYYWEREMELVSSNNKFKFADTSYVPKYKSFNPKGDFKRYMKVLRQPVNRW